MYIDAIVNGTLQRTLVNPDIDWNHIKNKPEGIVAIYYDTMDGWNSKSDLIAELSAIYVYTDGVIINNKPCPKIKIGDGKSYLIDTPFLNDGGSVPQIVQDHITDSEAHVSSEDREFWNNKIRVKDSQIQEENLIFTIN